MPAYSLTVTTTDSISPKLAKGKIRSFASVPVNWVIGENPKINSTNCAILEAGQVIELRLPFSCSRLAVQAFDEPGCVTITEISGGAKASCSA